MNYVYVFSLLKSNFGILTKSIMAKSNNKLKAVDFFCSVGGVSLGLNKPELKF